MKAIAARVCEAVQQGPSSDCDLVKLGILVWKSDDEIEVKHGRLVPGEGYQQTVAGPKATIPQTINGTDANYRLGAVERSTLDDI